ARACGGDAALERQVASDEPHDQPAHEQREEEGEGTPPADSPKPAPGLARSGPGMVAPRLLPLASGPRRSRNLALDAPAAIDAIKLGVGNRIFPFCRHFVSGALLAALDEAETA